MSYLALVTMDDAEVPNPTSGKIRLYSSINHAYGNICTKDSFGNIIVYSPGITQEQVEDIVGNLLQDSSTINVSYDDVGNLITFNTIDSAINHNALLNYSANKHIDHSLVSVIAGTGLSGGGDLTTSRTINLANTAVTAGTYGSATQVPVFAVDAQGRITSVTNTNIVLASTNISDFNEATDDRVSILIQNGTGISWTYNDALNTLTPTISLSPFSTTNLTEGTNLYYTQARFDTAFSGKSTSNLAEGTNLYYTDIRARAAISTTDSASIDFTYLAGNITAVVLPAGVDHNSLNNFVANKHIDHSLVTFTAGTGLTGGGDLTANRTFALANLGTAGSYGNATTVPVITTDAQGRVSNVTLATINGVPATNITNTPSGNISSTNVQAAINELDSEKIATTEKGVANGVCPLNSLTKIDAIYLPSYVDDVLEYANLAAFPASGEVGKIYVALDTNKTYRWSGTVYIEISASPVTTVFGRTGNVVSANGDYSASQITNTPSGSISSVTVQNALNELDTEKVATTRQVLAGTGLVGGGALSADVTISMPSVGTAGTYGSATQVPVFTTDAQGRVTSVTNTAITLASGTISDFNEAAQDAVGSMLANTASISFTYNDTTNSLTANVLPAGVNHNALQNYVANEHVNHTNVSIIAGTGLTGGGDLTASRTLNIATTGVTASTYGSATQVAVFTVNAQGQLSAATNTTIAIPSSQVTDFSEAVDDRIAALLIQGAGITLTYNDPANTLTIASSIVQYTDEMAQDAVASLIQNGTGISWAYNDTNNTLTPTVSLSAFSTSNLAEGTNLYFTAARAQAAISILDTTSVDFSYTAGVISAVVLPAGVNHNALQNYAANEHINHANVSIIAGTGLTGGGDLTANRTFALTTTGVTASSYGSANQVASFSVDAQGRLTAASNVAISIASAAITDFSEAAQDAVGGILVDTASIDFTYNDAGNSITANVLPAGVDHNALLNFAANKHIDHSTVAITAGTGLTGGGDLTANRTISMPNVGTAGVYGTASSYPIITTDAQGRISSVSLQSYNVNVWTDAGGFLTWADDTGKDLVIRQASNTGESPYIRFVKSLGTLAAPVATPLNEEMGVLGGYGWNSTGVNGLPSVEILIHASENHTNTAWGGELRINTIANGTTTSVTRAIWRNDGLLDQRFGLRVGDTTDTTAGNIRFNNGELQYRDATSWRVLNTTPQTITSTATVTTTSSTFSVVSSMTNTPAAGSYQVFFSCSASIDTDGNGDIGLFINGVEQPQCRRNQNGVATGSATCSIESTLMFITLITVDGTDVVDVRFRRNTAGTFSVKARELIFIPIARG